MTSSRRRRIPIPPCLLKPDDCCKIKKNADQGKRLWKEKEGDGFLNVISFSEPEGGKVKVQSYLATATGGFKDGTSASAKMGKRDCLAVLGNYELAKDQPPEDDAAL